MIALSRTDPGSPARPGSPDPGGKSGKSDKSDKPVQYAYLGPEGTFTEAALLAFDPGAAGHAMPCVSIQATLDAVRTGAAEQGIVPIENSVEGAVTATLDALAAGQDLVISAEVPLPVAFALLGRPGTQLADITTVGGHPQAQAQCRRWLEEHLPHAAWRPASSNAEAARQVADGELDAALAGAFAADMYGLAVLVADTHDHPNAVTRFVVVNRPGPLPRRLGRTGPRWWPSCARTIRVP